MGEMWDVEDPKNAGNPLFCDLIADNITPKPFTRVFENQAYVVLRVG